MQTIDHIVRPLGAREGKPAIHFLTERLDGVNITDPEPVEDAAILAGNINPRNPYVRLLGDLLGRFTHEKSEPRGSNPRWYHANYRHRSHDPSRSGPYMVTITRLGREEAGLGFSAHPGSLVVNETWGDPEWGPPLYDELASFAKIARIPMIWVQPDANPRRPISSTTCSPYHPSHQVDA